MNIEQIYDQKLTEKSDINEHLPTLRRYAGFCQHVTEFGVRTIVSTWALIAARPKFVVSYDQTHPGIPAIAHVTNVAADAGVAFRFICADVRAIQIDHTDLLFIDTYHTYNQLRAELSAHAANVDKYILLHDTMTFGHQGEAASEKGLSFAIDEFLIAHPEWKTLEIFTNNNGLTVLAKK